MAACGWLEAGVGRVFWPGWGASDAPWLSTWWCLGLLRLVVLSLVRGLASWRREGQPCGVAQWKTSGSRGARPASWALLQNGCLQGLLPQCLCCGCDWSGRWGLQQCQAWCQPLPRLLCSL